MKTLLFVAALTLNTSCLSQQPTPPAAPTASAEAVAIKPSPASEALIAAARSIQEEQKSLTEAFNQARSTLDLNQKTLQQSLTKSQNDLAAQLKQDKKYKDEMAQIDVLGKQIQDAGNKAQEDFQTKARPLQSQLASNTALLNGLLSVVRKENGLPDSATFDTATQTWHIPENASKAKK